MSLAQRGVRAGGKLRLQVATLYITHSGRKMYTAACIMTNLLPHVLQGDWNVFTRSTHKVWCEAPIMHIGGMHWQSAHKEHRGEENTLNAFLLI